jgi:hypothetical protein
MECIEEFSLEGKNFFYFDLTKVKSNEEFKKVIEAAKPLIQKYPKQSIYTITNIKGIRHDIKTQSIAAEWMKQNKPYVKFGAIVGANGITKVIANAVFTISERKNMKILDTKDEAVEWLLKQN